MKIALRNLFMLGCSVLLWIQHAQAQLTNWQYASVIEISEQQGNTYTDEQVLISINTGGLIANGQMQATGADMRFSTDCDGNNLLNYYIETGINTSDTKVWVLVPQILPFVVTKIYFFSGNPVATPGTDFSNTFPNALIIPTLTITNLFGTLDYDWFEVEAGATVNLLPGIPLDINANKIKINGVINGSGLGSGGGLPGGGFGSGFGGGAGSSTVNDGAGGAGHGGAGGAGGYTVTLYPGGSSYGSPTSIAGNMGSGGGGGIIEFGGDGGGSISVNGIDVEITGTINVDGQDGNSDLVNLQGTGGGSGGSALAIGRFLNITGSVSAKGGNGGSDVNPAFGGGGGGSGGRVKAFYYNSASIVSVPDVSGGAGGCCGVTPSSNGDAGTIYQEQLADIYSITVNPMILKQSPVITGEDAVCNNSTETYTASVIAGDTYLWSATGGNVVSGQATNTVEIHWIGGGSQTLTLVTTNIFLGCSETTTYSVFVSAGAPVANFGFTPACVSSPVFFSDSSTILVGSIISYEWDFGDGNTSTTQSPQHTYASAGPYTVNLMVTSDNGCTNNFSAIVTVEAFPDATFTTTTICQGLATTFTPNSLAGFSYLWNFGDGNTSTSTSPTYTYAASGTYTITLEVTSAGGCVSVETNSVIVNPLPVADFDFASACPNTNVEFTNLSSISSGSLSYIWDFGDLNISSATNPTHAYSIEGTYTVTLTDSSSSGCANTISKSVVVYPVPIANFSVNPVCQGTASEFSNSSSIASGFIIYAWDFGDGSLLSNALNPTHLYSSDGLFPVALTATSDKGCSSAANGNAVVYEQPSALFSANNVCLGDSTVFTNNSTSGPSITYFWSFGDGNFSPATNPSHTYASAGNYIVTLDVTTSDGCIAQAQQTITVYPTPSAAFTAPGVCQGNGTQFTNTSSISAGIMNFNWDFGDGGSSLLDNPLHVYADTGSYLVTLVAVSDNGCTDTSVSNVTVLLQPHADYSILTGCFGSDIVIVDLSTSYDSMAYYQVDIFNDGIYEYGPFAAGDTAIINVPSTGAIATRIRLTNFSGCADSVIKTMTINPFPVAGFTASDLCFGGSVNFANTTSSTDPNLLGALAYQWNFGDANSSTDINPSHQYDSSGIFTVTLIAVSNAGCSDTFNNTLIVYPLPVTDFTSGVACFEKDVVFTNTTTIPFGGVLTYHWEFGDGVTFDTLVLANTPFDVSHKYTSIGIYQVHLTVTSDAGCVSDITKDVTVYPNPTSNFMATDVCENDTNKFFNLSSVSSGTLTYLWDFGDSFNSVDEDPTHVYASDGGYDVSLTTTSDFGCTDTRSRIVTVFAKPNINFTAANVCDGEIVDFTNATTVPGGNMLFNIWHFGDGGVSFDLNTSHVYDAYGTYSVNLTVQSDEGCRDSLLQAVIVFRKPDVLITHNGPLAFCNGGDVTLAALPFPITNTYTYAWSSGETDSSIVVTTDGNFCVTVIDQNGCMDDTCEIVTIWAMPAVTASSDVDSISKGYIAHLFATGGTSYQWSADPVDPTLDPNIQTPTVAPIVTTTYTVTATDLNGCTGTATVTITVNEDYFVHATNVITPNGDAYNQNWYVENILTYPNNEVLIFDRWGTLVYQKKAYDNSWEGTHDGKELNQGTYYYVIKFDGYDKVYKGSVSIVR